jgi:hypothetical protein
MRTSSLRAERIEGRPARQALPDDSRAAARSVRVDQHFALLRQCIQDCGYTLDALAVAMSSDLPKPIDKGYLWRLLNDPAKHGEWKVAHEIALPDDVEALYRERQAEGWGRIVVVPVEGEQAVRQFVSGMLGLFGHNRLPARASRMAKAALEEK